MRINYAKKLKKELKATQASKEKVQVTIEPMIGVIEVDKIQEEKKVPAIKQDKPIIALESLSSSRSQISLKSGKNRFSGLFLQTKG